MLRVLLYLYVQRSISFPRYFNRETERWEYPILETKILKINRS